MPKRTAPIDLSDSFEKIPVKIFPDIAKGSLFVAQEIAALIREKQKRKERNRKKIKIKLKKRKEKKEIESGGQ